MPLPSQHRLTFAEEVRLAAFCIGKRLNCLKTLERLNEIPDDRLFFGRGRKQFVLLKNPDDIRQILRAPTSAIGHSQHQSKYISVRDSNNPVVTSAHGEDWKNKRKDMNRFMNIHGLKLGFQQDAEQLITQHLDGWADQPSIAVAQEASRLALKYMFKASFNTTLSNQQCDDLHKAADIMHRYLFLSVLTLGFVSKGIIKSITNIRSIAEIYANLIDQLIKDYEQLDARQRDNHLFSALLPTEHPLQDQRHKVHSIIGEMLVAGHLSVRTSFYWALHSLARHPEYQDKIAAEAKQRMKTLCPMNAPSLPASLTATFETLRLYPAFFIFLKETTGDFSGENGLFIKDATTIMVPPWLVHRNPQYYERPESFDPDINFAPQTIKNRNKFAYLPFGHGPHNCAGQGMTLQQMSSTLSEICSRYSLAPLNGEEALPRVHSNVFLKPENDSVLAIRPR